MGSGVLVGRDLVVRDRASILVGRVDLVGLVDLGRWVGLVGCTGLEDLVDPPDPVGLVARTVLVPAARTARTVPGDGFRVRRRDSVSTVRRVWGVPVVRLVDPSVRRRPRPARRRG